MPGRSRTRKERDSGGVRPGRTVPAGEEWDPGVLCLESSGTRRTGQGRGGAGKNHLWTGGPSTGALLSNRP